MNMSPAETTLIDVVRGKAGPVFTISITSTNDIVAVTLAMPGGGVTMASGPTFDAALYRICRMEPPADREPVPRQH